MPDITMCKGESCPKRETCYRYTAKPSEYQSYFSEIPYKGGVCKHYWTEEEDNTLKILLDIVNGKSN